MTTTKISAQFYFEEPYALTLKEGNANFPLKAGVLLDVNYQAKTFSISPQNPTDNFEFPGNRSGDYKKWKATVKAIDAAIDYGFNEVGGNEVIVTRAGTDKNETTKKESK